MLKKIGLVIFSVMVLSLGSGKFYGRGVKDVYPLHKPLQYSYNTTKDYKSPVDLMSDIIKNLDIENNERYFKTGVVYKEGKIYEIPLKEVKDFNIKPRHYNTYCNIFVIDVLNIVANTLNEGSYKIVNEPVNANTLRTKFEDSRYWEEVSEQEAISCVRGGQIVVLSYIDQPHGHVAFVRPDSDLGNVLLWNVGRVNKNKVKWNKDYNTKYFVKVRG